ncbi:glutathione S-transferase family protein [Enterobacter sp. 63]
MCIRDSNNSRSARILWLLEEAEIDYELVRYQRDPKTNFSPDELKSIHPLGKSPVIEIDGNVIAESGAITEYLIAQYAPRLAPNMNTPQYIEYLQWIHFAESSAMLPVLLRVFGEFEKNTGTQLNFLDEYASNEYEKVFSFLNNKLYGRQFIIGDSLSGADIMLGFVISIALEQFGAGKEFPHISHYADRLRKTNSWQKMQAIESAGI